MGYILRHIMPLVTNSFRDGHTDTHIQISQTRAISRNQVHKSLQPMGTYIVYKVNKHDIIKH